MALDTWDPRAAPAGTPIGLPAITSPYPQQGTAYTDPVTRPAPTLSSLNPNTMAAASATPTVVTATGTNYTTATHFSFGGVVDSPRITGVSFISATSAKVSVNPVGLTAAAYAMTAINQDGQASAGSNFTVT